MQLNIYLISHPIIKFLSDSIIYSQDNSITKNKYSHHIGLLLIYEIMRKWTRIRNIYIKKLSYIQELSLLNSNQRYYIFTNLSQTYQIVTEIESLLPNIQIIHAEYNKHISYPSNMIFSDFQKKNIKIIILERILYQDYIVKLIQELNINKKIPLDQINIACISCYKPILDIIGKAYPELNIYTTKITIQMQNIT
uniref:Uracil phosphoribosyltransferase n=1 Tax=Plumaria plumosa TaxID=189642 RepID=A0A4D6WZQ4_9FLOR|nr:hypothetical protein [Plumaria plumosa]